MKTNITPIPPGYTTVTPWIITKDSAKLIEFLQQAFNAQEIPGSRMADEKGTIMHVEVKIGNAIVMLFDAGPDWGPTPAFIRLYVEDGDAVFKKSLDAGAEPVTDMTHLFFGDSVGRVRDPFGNVWWIQQRIEDVSQLHAAEINKRASTKEAMESMEYVQRSLQEAMSTHQEKMGIVRTF
jgi:PhnB protein